MKKMKETELPKNLPKNQTTIKSQVEEVALLGDWENFFPLHKGYLFILI